MDPGRRFRFSAAILAAIILIAVILAIFLPGRDYNPSLVDGIPAGTGSGGDLHDRDAEGSGSRTSTSEAAVDTESASRSESSAPPAVGLNLVSGKVLDRSGKTVSGARVVLHREDDSIARGIRDSFDLWEYKIRADVETASALTETDGRFVLSSGNADEGFYCLHAASHGKGSTFRGGVRIPWRGRDLELVLEAAFTLRGEVMDATGNPVEGAQVIMVVENLSKATARAEFRKFRTQSDSEGLFIIDGLPESGWDDILIFVTKTGLGNYLDWISPRQSEIKIRFGHGFRVEGRVLDIETGATLPNARMLILPLGGTGFMRIAADGNGLYRVDETGPGYVEVKISALGYPLHSETIEGVPGSSMNHDFRIRKGAKVRGKVIDMATRSPLEGARVHACNQLGDFMVEGRAPEAMSGPEGEFTIVAAPVIPREIRKEDGEWHTVPCVVLRALKPGWVQGDYMVVQVEEGVPGLENLEVPLLKAARVAGRVVDSRGKPVEGAEIFAEGGDMLHEDRAQFGENPVRAVSGPDGAFMISGGIGPDARLLILGPSHAPSSFALGELAPGAVIGDFEAKICRGGQLSGIVTNPDGAPLSGVKVDYELFLSENLPSGLREHPVTKERMRGTETGPDGTFFIRNLCPGEWTFVFPAWGAYAPHRQTAMISEGETTKAHFLIGRFSVIRGAVTDEEGRPLAGVHISIVNRTQSGFSSAGDSMSDERGEFELQFTEQNSLFLDFSMYGYKPLLFDHVKAGRPGFVRVCLARQ